MEGKSGEREREGMGGRGAGTDLVFIHFPSIFNTFAVYLFLPFLWPLPKRSWPHAGLSARLLVHEKPSLLKPVLNWVNVSLRT